MDEAPLPAQQVMEGMAVVGAILLAFFLLAYAVFDTWADWGPNGPVNDWTNLPMLLLAFCGVTQAVYVVPCYLFFRKKNLPHTARGVVWGAVLVLAVNLAAYLWWSRG